MNLSRLDESWFYCIQIAIYLSDNHIPNNIIQIRIPPKRVFSKQRAHHFCPENLFLHHEPVCMEVAARQSRTAGHDHMICRRRHGDRVEFLLSILPNTAFTNICELYIQFYIQFACILIHSRSEARYRGYNRQPGPTFTAIPTFPHHSTMPCSAACIRR